MVLKQIKEEIENNHFDFKKKYGQNFIIDENIINKIINSADIDENTLVIEVGPGAGSLTEKLVEKAGFVLCYEIDETLKPILENTLNDVKNAKVIFEDFLKDDVKKTLKEFKYEKVYVVSNLPYYITTPIIMKLIDDQINPQKIIVMVQKEVGNRFKALPNTKDYSSLSIFLNYYFDVSKIMDVSRNVFLPKPNVDSIVIEMKEKKCKYNVKNEEIFFKIVRDSFKQKRKTIKNNLKEYDLDKIEEVLKKYGFSLDSRAEQIPTEVFIEIVNMLDK